MNGKILIVDDERIIRKALKDILEGAGYLTIESSNGRDAVSVVRRERIDLVLLDVMMPLMDGRTACAEIRKTDAGVPVIFLTALDSPDDEIRGLESGGDDYISKTSRADVLLARIASALRRSQPEKSSGNFMFGNWIVNLSGLFMSRNGTSGTTPLSDREAALLKTFRDHPDEIFSRDYLARTLSGANADLSDETLTMMIVRLRSKLGEDGRFIRTVRGAGYEYNPQR